MLSSRIPVASVGECGQRKDYVPTYITLISFGSSFGAVQYGISRRISNAGKEFNLRMIAIDEDSRDGGWLPKVRNFFGEYFACAGLEHCSEGTWWRGLRYFYLIQLHFSKPTMWTSEDLLFVRQVHRHHDPWISRCYMANYLKVAVKAMHAHLYVDFNLIHRLQLGKILVHYICSSCAYALILSSFLFASVISSWAFDQRPWVWHSCKTP